MADQLPQDQERDAFEAWQSLIGKDADVDCGICSPGTPTEGEYRNHYTQVAWEAWQAARASDLDMPLYTHPEPDAAAIRAQALETAAKPRADCERDDMICGYGNPLCPCPDGDPCHYEGENPWPAPYPFEIWNWALEEACKVVYGQCGSDNVAERTVQAIRALAKA